MNEAQLRKSNQEDIDNLQSVCSTLDYLVSKLKPLLSESLVNDLKEARVLAKTTLEKHTKLENEYQNKVFDALYKISEEHNLVNSRWSISEVEPEDFDKPFSDKPVKSISYNGNTITLPGNGKMITWLDAWKYADQLIQDSEDEHHIFIEDFMEDNRQSGHFEVTTGS